MKRIDPIERQLRTQKRVREKLAVKPRLAVDLTPAERGQLMAMETFGDVTYRDGYWHLVRRGQ
jgi:hypothetical protein